MRDRLLRQLDAFDRARQSLLDELATLSPDVLAFVPASGGWSILGVVEHLVRAERSVLQNLPDVGDLVDRPRSLRDRAAFELVWGVLRSPVSVGTPSPAMDPQGGVGLSKLRRQWDASQAWLRAYLDSASDLDRAVFAHPITGPIGVRQVLSLSEVHLRRHTRQIRRIQLDAEDAIRPVSPRT